MIKNTIKLLDLFCGAGGAAMGYFMAAKKMNIKIEIIGVDNVPQSNYPFEFVQADALNYLKNNYRNFTHIHASPPCQQYSKATSQFRKLGKTYPDLILPVRDFLEKIKLPSIIENVPSAPIRPDVKLRGDMFGLHVLRTRIFENINWFMMNPIMPPKRGSVMMGDYCCVMGKGAYGKSKKDLEPKFKKKSVLETWKYAMDISWMKTERELSQAVPTAYTNFIGLEFFK